MTIQVSGQVGPVVVSDGTTANGLRQAKSGELMVSEVQARYYEQNYRGNLFSLSVATAAAITAYTGGAAGTPQIALWNPSGSNRNAIIISANYANVVAASGAGTATWGLYYGPTAAITQSTKTTPVQGSTLTAGGSVMTGFTNVALTGSTALTNVMPLGAYYWATAASAAVVSSVAPAFIDGMILIPPGSMVALGGSAALTSATWIGSLVWIETPI